MKNKKMVLWLVLIVISVISIYAQQYDSEKDFEIDWDPNVKAGIIITKYIGTKKEIRIPPSIQNFPVTGIGSGIFYENANLTSITIPNSVTNIGDATFAFTSLTSVTIPKSVTSIGEGTFSSCKYLTTINVDVGNTAYISQGGVLYNKNKTSLIAYPAGKTETTFVIPNGVTSIGSDAFSGSRLTSITIPNSVTSISDGAFSGCTNLTSITIPNNVTSIESRTFSDCTSLNSVTIPDSVTRIGVYAFMGCTNLASITIPNSVTNIVGDAFRKCTNLTSVTFATGSNISDANFGRNAFPEGSSGVPGNSLKTAYSTGKAGTYTRTENGSTWTKQTVTTGNTEPLGQTSKTAQEFSNRGVDYLNKGDYDQAIADFNQAIQLKPDYAIAYNNRGSAYYNKKDYDRAIADYNQALRIDPNYQRAKDNLVSAYIYRGIAYREKGDYDRAFADYNQALLLDPNSSTARNNLASAYIYRGNEYRRKGDYDRAIADYTQAVKIDPNDAVCYYSLGSAYYMKGDYNRAITNYEAALKIDPNDANAKKYLEESRKLRGQQQEEESWSNFAESLDQFANSMAQIQQNQRGGSVSGGNTGSQGKAGSSGSSNNVNTASMQSNYNTREKAVIQSLDTYRKANSDYKAGRIKLSDLVYFYNAFRDQQKGLKSYREECNRKGANIKQSYYETVNPDPPPNR